MTITRDAAPKEKSLLGTMLEPRWIAMLVLAIAVAGAFAWLGQWQLSRAVMSAETTDAPTEVVAQLSEVAKPGSALRETVVGQRVETAGQFVPGDFIVIVDRINLGASGYWVTGHFVTDDGVALAVALGWAESREAADAAAKKLNGSGADELPASVTGRILSTQGPAVPAEGRDPHELNMMSVAALINLWSGMGDVEVYSAYLVSQDAPAGLTVIDAPTPERQVQLNWLNVFYAAEWVVFAGFAFFLWYRLVRDAWERAADERELAAKAAPNDTVN